jgi:CRP-like cAMP-binding protein
MEQKTHFLELPMPAIYFIESGLISMFATLENGNAAEVGLVGYEGMLGLPLLDDEFDDLKRTVVCPGTALRVSTAAFQEALEQLPNLRGLVDRYTLWCLTARWRQARPKLAAMVLLK